MNNTFKMEGVSTVTALLGVEVFNISEQAIHNLRIKSYNKERVFDDLPEYTINTSEKGNNGPIKAEYFHQFMGYTLPKKNLSFIYFNMLSCDSILDQEMNNIGVEMFVDFDFSVILKPFIPTHVVDEADHGQHLTKTNYIIVELRYITSQDHLSGGWECEVEYDVVGYLDADMNKLEYEKK